MDNISKEVFINPIFSGREVTRQVLLPESKEYEVGIIKFGKEVRNKFHVHDCEQILQVAFRNRRSENTDLPPAASAFEFVRAYLLRTLRR